MSEATLGTTTLVGRDGQLALLRARLDAARDGHGSAVVLRGEPGVGKSALIDALTADAGEALVLRCRGVEAEVELPFGGLHELLGPLRGAIGSLPTELGSALTAALAMHSEEPASAVNASMAALTLLAEAAASTPVVLVVDDIHWIDESSLLALTFIARRLAHDRLLLVAAARPGAAADALPGERIDVEPLTAAEVAALAGRLLGQVVPQAIADVVLAGTGGNPLAVVEAIRLLGSDVDRWGTMLDEPLPPGELIERGFASRLDGLDAAVADVLLVIATALDGSTATVLAAAAQLGIAPDALTAAEDAGVVVPRDGAPTFSHPLLRSLVYHRATPAARRRAHGALAATTADAGAAAWHAASATPVADEALAAALTTAAEDFVRRGGVVTATRALEQAARITPDIHDRARRLLRAAGLARSALRPAWSDELHREAHAAAAGDRALQLRIELSHFSLTATAGSNANLVDRSAELVEAARTIDRHLFLDALCLLVEEGVMAGRMDVARKAVAELEAVGPIDDPHLQEVVIASLCTAMSHLGESSALLRERLRFVGESAIRTPSRGCGGIIENLVWAEEDELAERLAQASSRRARERGDLQLLLQAQWGDGYRRYVRGEWAASDVAYATSLELATDSGIWWFHAIATAFRAILHGAQGRESALALADHADRVAKDYSYTFEQYSAQARGSFWLARGDVDAALTHLRACAEWHLRAEHLEPCSLTWPVDVVEAELLAGNRAAAEAAHAWFDERVELVNRHVGRAASARLRGMLATDDAFAAHFEASIRRHRDLTAPFELARTHLHYGRRLRDAGDGPAAQAQFAEARKLFLRLDAEGWLAQVDRDLRGTGAAPASAGADLLTAQEKVVADCVAQGMTNKEAAAHLFLTTKTIEWHLRQIYRKLGIRSRVQLAQHVHTQAEQ